MNDFYNLYGEIVKNPTVLREKRELLINSGITVVQQTLDLTVKEDILLKLIQYFPQEPGLYFYMGFAFKKTNPEKALTYYKKSYDLCPNHLENMIDLIDLYFALGMPQSVLEMDKNDFFQQFLHDIRFVVIYYQCLIDVSYVKAIKYIKQVIEYYTIRGCNTEKEKEIYFYAHTHIANVYSSMSEHELCVEFAEKSFVLAKKYRTDNKSFFSALIALLFEFNYIYSDNEVTRQKCIELNKYIPSIQKFSFHHRKYQPIKKIKVAYLSSDYIGHAVSNFILPIIHNHDKNKFEIILLLNNKGGGMVFDYMGFQCYNLIKMQDDEAAIFIYNLEIDILIDLNGFTANHRMGILSYNPAPVQISYLGYPNTTGLDFMHYRITDKFVDNENSTQYYAEKLIRLPRSFLLYKSFYQTEPVIPRKTTGTIMLASLNKENKLNNQIFEIWKHILSNYPNTKLLIKLDRGDDDYAERVAFYKTKLPMENGRVLLLKKMDNDGYVNLFGQIDILLDTFPYSGTTTTCNALYNSIPVVTLYHENSHVHNVSSSILMNMGVNELIARTVTEYIGIVENLIQNPVKIDEYKASLHTKFVELMEPAPFMKEYEHALMQGTYGSLANPPLIMKPTVPLRTLP